MAVFQDIASELAQWDGSAKLELSDYAATDNYSPCGGLKSLKAKYGRKVENLERINTSKRPVLVEESLTIEAESTELLHSKTWDRIMGTSSKTIVPGTAVTGKTQEIVATKDKGYQLNYENADGSAPTITTCVNSLGVAYSKYEVTEIGGFYFISFDDSDTYTLTMSYTPIASIKYAFGALSSIPFFKARLTNKDANGKVSRITLYKAANVGDVEISFQSDNATDKAATFQLKIEAYYDDTYMLDSKGNAQIGEIYSERFTN